MCSACLSSQKITAVVHGEQKVGCQANPTSRVGGTERHPSQAQHLAAAGSSLRRGQWPCWPHGELRDRELSGRRRAQQLQRARASGPSPRATGRSRLEGACSRSESSLSRGGHAFLSSPAPAELGAPLWVPKSSLRRSSLQPGPRVWRRWPCWTAP